MIPEQLAEFRAAHDAAAEQAKRDQQQRAIEAAIAQIEADRKAGNL